MCVSCKDYPLCEDTIKDYGEDKCASFKGIRYHIVLLSIST